jgi:DNA replication and repair protein RecF
MTAAFIQRLTLTNFRSYHAAQVTLDRAGPVVLTGANGAGKTNLIEAISLLAPGRGLRRAPMDELAFSEGDGSWAVSAEIEGMMGLSTLGTGIDPPSADSTTNSRKCRVDRESVGSATAFAEHLRVVWLTPSMDPLFNGPASERRRFLDRLVLAVDAQHSSRVSALERSLRSRNRLLEDPRSDPHWLDAIEHETAVDIEDRYRALLKDNRARDAAAGRTLDGPHLSDFAVTHAAKGIPASNASTGEQKALLIRLILAHARLIKEMTGFAPVLLLDEVVAHLDPGRRAALYDALAALGAQVWMTGADPAAFGDITGRAHVLVVQGGSVAPAR